MHRSQPAGFIIDCQTEVLNGAAAFRSSAHANCEEQANTRA